MKTKIIKTEIEIEINSTDNEQEIKALLSKYRFTGEGVRTLHREMSASFSMAKNFLKNLIKPK